MDAVVALTAARSPGQLVSVGLQSGERLLLSTRRLAELRLAAGDELDGRRLAELRAAAEDERLEQRLLRLIAIRPRSLAEVERQLDAWGVPAHRASALVARLRAAGLLDDGVVAAEVSSGLRRRGHGSLRAAHDLERLGVDAMAAAPVIGDHAAGDESRARDLVTRRPGHALTARCGSRRLRSRSPVRYDTSRSWSPSSAPFACKCRSSHAVRVALIPRNRRTCRPG